MITTEPPVLLDMLTSARQEGINSLTQLQALLLVADSPGQTMSQLAFDLSISTAAITGMVDRLVDLDLVQRGPSSDRRVHLITLTEPGEQAVVRIRSGLFERGTEDASS